MIKHVITRGYGTSSGTVAYLITRGLGSYGTPFVPVAARVMTRRRTIRQDKPKR